MLPEALAVPAYPVKSNAFATNVPSETASVPAVILKLIALASVGDPVLIVLVPVDPEYVQSITGVPDTDCVALPVKIVVPLPAILILFVPKASVPV